MGCVALNKNSRIAKIPLGPIDSSTSIGVQIQYYNGQDPSNLEIDNLFTLPFINKGFGISTYPTKAATPLMKSYSQMADLRKILRIFKLEDKPMDYPNIYSSPFQIFKQIKSYFDPPNNSNITVFQYISGMEPSDAYFVGTNPNQLNIFLNYTINPISLPLGLITYSIGPQLGFNVSQISIQRSEIYGGGVSGKLSSSNLLKFPITSSVPKQPITFNKIESIKVSPTTQLLRITITSVYPLAVVFIGEVINPKLISGSRINGVFEMEVQTQYFQFGYQMVFTDSSGFNSVLYYSQAYNSDFSVLPSELKFDKNETFDLTTIQTINFTNRIMNYNLNYLPINNSVVFSTTQQNPDLIPTIDFGNSNVFKGIFDPYIQSYSINFTVPPLVISGDFYYTIGLSGFYIQSSDLRSKFGGFASLKISNLLTSLQLANDIMKPLLTKLIAGSSIKLYGFLNWNLTIEDSPNGFLYGTESVGIVVPRCQSTDNCLTDKLIRLYKRNKNSINNS
ncbi:hypothetical protein PPL_02830 [Heterostelium album PN500]|uniref:Uncharacterized protein n=1 Tax=Heterostelium pallidum (strain ATCC 26659 / Pp 5 / PN500) TaxID=670386 RepID=D3B365_HETP5|nr:hypothetical protein PPL_02830 [Heterostelium album PN500]EFA83763.1 hypothetical protein PPL_02830 [Heterostelium album PN500]|eukprot:XP_020435880.1 hypothetical protein PPL_02830 [Heterostelium album PN500]